MKQKRRKLKKKVKIILLCSILFIALLSLALVLTFTGNNDKEEGYGNISNVNISPEEEGIGELTFMLIDVGQAQSIFIDFKDKEILIDGGKTKEDSEKIISAIDEYVDGPIEYVIATHSHEDHIGGLGKIYDRYSVNETIYGNLDDSPWCKSFIEKAKNSGKVRKDSDTTIELGPSTTLTIYDILNSQENINNDSVVCLLRHGDKSFYMAGDLEKEGEVKLRKTIENVDVAVLSHHGSSTSNTNLDILRPKICLASCGENNEYGYIHEEVLEKAVLLNSKVYATYKSGTIKITSDGKGLTYDMPDEERLSLSDAGSIVKKKKGKDK